METAVFLTKLDKNPQENRRKLNAKSYEKVSFVQEGFSRFYFGQEFCERLIPPEEELKHALDLAKELKMEFTLVTPYVTEKGLEQWEKLLETLYSLRPHSEVVINDWGILHLFGERFPQFTKVLGRLQTKQKRGPRILRLMEKVPVEMIEHFMCFNVDAPHLSAFYNSLGINRFELDNPPQGIKRTGSTQASLYFPYVYVSTTRMCLTNQSDHRRESMRAIFPCSRECREIHFNIEHNEIPIKVTIAGNTQFYYSDLLPSSLEELYINRLVFQPEIPM